MIPALAAAVTLALYFAFAAGVNLNNLSIPLRVVIKSGFAVGVFAVLIFSLQRNLLYERSSYLWGLVRGRGQDPVSPEST
jgi:hypothetical protein